MAPSLPTPSLRLAAKEKVDHLALQLARFVELAGDVQELEGDGDRRAKALRRQLAAMRPALAETCAECERRLTAVIAELAAAPVETSGARGHSADFAREQRRVDVQTFETAAGYIATLRGSIEDAVQDLELGEEHVRPLHTVSARLSR